MRPDLDLRVDVIENFPHSHTHFGVGKNSVPLTLVSTHFYLTVISADLVKRAKDIAKKVAR